MAAGEKTESYKGIYYGSPPSKEEPAQKRYISVSHAEIVDLLCEDGIEGLVYEKYNYNASAQEGDYGWGENGVTTQTFLGANNQYLLPGTTHIEQSKMCSIYWNEIPIVDKTSGKLNFTDIQIDTNQSLFRTQGFKNKRVKAIGERIKGSEENQTSHYKHYKIYNKECATIRLGVKVGPLGKVDRYAGTAQEPNENYGQLLDSDVTVSFWYRPIYSKKEVGFKLGKTSVWAGNLDTPYMRDIILNLPLQSARNDAANNNYGGFLGWEVQVIRSTPEPKTQDVKNTTILDSIQEEVFDTFSAPNSYIVKSKFNSEYFSQIPERAFDTKLLKVKIPSNYDPISKHYSGNWNGTFKSDKQWTDNPAWCFYDLISNKRYGLGKYIDQLKIDKWTLYEIGRYCDQLVIAADGGLEPRFTCNVLVQTREDAFKLLTDMASIFRAMVYYATGTVYAVQDSKKDSVFQFTNSDIENGDFTYTSTSAKVRHTVAIVRYNDKDNFYKPAVEYVDDIEGIRRYGIKEKEVTAFGCSSRGQAIRLGKWILATERLETETVSFVTGTQGSLLRPGDIFTVADSNRLMKRRGGRILDFTRVSNSQFTILLDGKLQSLDSNRDYELTLSAPSFFFDPTQTEIDNSTQEQFIRNQHVQKFTITNASVNYDSGNTGKSLITVNCTGCVNTAGTEINLGAVIDRMSWSILAKGVDDSAVNIQEKLNQSERFRVINVVEKEINKYEISASEYSEDKYDEVDKKLSYTNTITFSRPVTPSSITFTNKSREITEHTKAIDYSITTSDKSGLSYYAVYVAQGTGSNKDTNPFTSSIPSDEFLTDKVYSIDNATGTFIPASQSHYFFRVYAVNALEEYSTSYVENYVTASELGVVAPIKDVKISSLRLTDDTEANLPGVSDPAAGVSNYQGSGLKVDEFDGSSLRIAWQTTGLDDIAVNTSFEFTYRVRIYKGFPETGTLLFTDNDYKPMDWNMGFTSFELPENELINLTKAENNNSINLDDAYRSLSFVVDARDYSSTPSYSSEDILYVSNPTPRKADHPCNPSANPPVETNCLQGFIDINGHIKIMNFSRPIDAKSVYIIAAKTPFTYLDYVFSTGTSRANFGFNLLRINPIDSTDPVFEIDPSFKTEDMEIAYVAIAYTDDFDENLITYKTLNAINWDIDKKFARFENASGQPYGKAIVAGTSRVSNTLTVYKRTPEIMDLLGEGWKAWIKIDVNGQWKGRNVQCIKDVTSEYDDYKGYLPFYCGRRIPWVKYTGLYSAGSIANWNPADIELMPTMNVPNFRDMYTQGCLYYMPTHPNDTEYPREAYTDDTPTVGGYSGTTWHTPVTGHPYENYRFPKDFKRYRIYFKPNKGFVPDNYWVVGMNANEKPYFTNDMVKQLGRLRTHVSSGNDSFDAWEPYLEGGAAEALGDATGNDLTGVGPDSGGGWGDGQGEHGEVYIGGSDAYFNYHPAGFVQGFGGLQKQSTHFDVHLGHMIDGSYLKDAVFFVMAIDSTTEYNGPDPNCTAP